MKKNNISEISKISERLYKKLTENIDSFSKEEMIKLSSYQFEIRELFNRIEPMKNRIYDLAVTCEKEMDKILLRKNKQT